MDCDYLLPNYNFLIDNKDGNCLRPAGHEDGHLVKLKDGSFLEWWPDWLTCEHGPDENCECFSYKHLSAKEAQEKLKR